MKTTASIIILMISLITSAFAADASLYFGTDSNVCRIHIFHDDSSKSMLHGPFVIGKDVSNKVVTIPDQGIQSVVVSVSCMSPTKIDFVVTTFQGINKKSYLKARQSREELYRIDLFDAMVEKL
jgi:hypothetical protein